MDSKLKISFGIVTVIMVVILIYLIINDPSYLIKRERVKLDKLKELYKELAIFENKVEVTNPKIQILDSLLNKESLDRYEKKELDDLMQELGHDFPSSARLNKFADVVDINFNILSSIISIKREYLEYEINDIIKKISFYEDSIATIRENIFAEYEIKKVPPYYITEKDKWDGGVWYIPTADMTYDYSKHDEFTIQYQLLRYGDDSPYFYIFVEYKCTDSYWGLGNIYYNKVELKANDVWFSIKFDREKIKWVPYREWCYHRVPDDYINEYYDLVKADTIMVRFFGKTYTYTYRMPKEQVKGLREIVKLYQELGGEDWR